MINSFYYMPTVPIICLLVLSIARNRVNKFGFSQRDFDAIKKNRNFSHIQDVKFMNMHVSLMAVFNFLAFLAAYGVVFVSGIVAITSTFDLVATTNESGDYIKILTYSTVFDYSGAKIGSSHFATSVSSWGIALICLLAIFLIFSNVFYYFTVKLCNPKNWSKMFFYDVFLEKFNEQDRERKQKLWMMIFTIFHILINVCVLASIISCFVMQATDLSYYLVNFSKLCTSSYGNYKISLSDLNIPCVVFNTITVLASIMWLVALGMCEDYTWTRYQASMIYIYNQECEVKVGNIK